MRRLNDKNEYSNTENSQERLMHTTMSASLSGGNFSWRPSIVNPNSAFGLHHSNN